MADFVAHPDGGMVEKGTEVNQAATAKTAEEIAAEEAAKAEAEAEAQAQAEADAAAEAEAKAKADADAEAGAEGQQ
jgi:hypothetical protein